MTRRIRASLIAVSVATTLTLAGAGVAYGYWSTSGAGVGTAPVSGAVVPLVVSTGTPVAALNPGSSASVYLTVTNSNPYSVHINSFSLDPTQGTNGFAVDPGHAACSTAVLSFTTQTSGWTVPPRIGTTNGTATITLSTLSLGMSAAAANACQGAAFTVYLVAG